MATQTFVLLGTSLGDPLTLTVPAEQAAITQSALANLGFEAVQ